MRDPEGRLWRAVVVQAIFDVAGGTRSERDAVLHWLTLPEFGMICDAASAQPDAIRRLAYEIIKIEDKDVRMGLVRRIRSRLLHVDDR